MVGLNAVAETAPCDNRITKTFRRTWTV